MGVDLLLFGLARANVAAAATILFVLALRAPVRWSLGAEPAYALWALPVAAALVSFFPGLNAFCDQPPIARGADRWLGSTIGPVSLIVWVLGAGFMVGFHAVAEFRFRRLAARRLSGPAVVGLLWPSIVTPRDHDLRFDAFERGLILAHERAHIHRGDPWANLIMAGLQAVCWFNPAVHVAILLARSDQEVACDAAAIAFRPDLRGRYARTLVKAASPISTAPLACGWAHAPSAVEDRVRTLMRSGGMDRHMAAEVLLGAVLLMATAGAVWLAAPTSGIAHSSRPEASRAPRVAATMTVSLRPSG